MDKKMTISALVAVIAVMIVGVVVIMPGSGPGTMNFNGTEYTYEELVAEFGTQELDGMTGVPLDSIIMSTDFADLNPEAQNETFFQITAEDGWQKNVSWVDIHSGILVEEDLMTYFADLPGAYKVKNVASIDDIDIGPIAIITADASWGSATETTWTELFAEIDEATFTDNNQDMTGIELVDVFEYAGFSDLGNATFTFVGVDGYEKSVNYTEVQAGYLVEEDNKTYFLNLSGQYRVKNIIRIIVEL